MLFRTGFVGRPLPVGLAGPSLGLDFTSGTLDPRITFTRAAGPATYFDNTGTMQTAGTNVARFDYDPASLQLKGLLIEEARTNLILQSADLGNAAWNKAGGVVAAPTVTSNQAVALDGTTTAARVVYPQVIGASAFSAVSQSFTATAAAYTFSIWLRGNAGGETLYVRISDAGATTYYRQLVTLTTSWQRYSVTTSNLTAASWFCAIGTDLRDGGETTQPAQTIFAWGAQVELGSFQTSYIPTTGATATRPVDVAAIPYNNYSAVNGTLFVEFIYGVSYPTGIFPTILAASDGTGNNAISMFYSGTASRYRTGVASGGSATFDTFATSTASIVPNAIARNYVTWAASNSWVVETLSGAVAAQLTGTGATPIGVNTLKLGANASGGTTGAIWLRRIKAWPRTLSSNELTVDASQPTLDIGFIDPPAGLDSRITFTRATTATYFGSDRQMKLAASGAPRFDHDPATGAPLGLLIEEARTNLAPHATDLSFWNSNIAPNDSLRVQNAGLAPDGTNTATLVIPSTNVGAKGCFLTFSGATSTAYNWSVYLKAAGYNRGDIALANTGFPAAGSCTFDLGLGTITAQGAGANSSGIQYAGNGWFRVWVNVTSLGSAGTYVANISLRMGNNSSTINNADGVSGLLCWGAQAEAGAFPTSFIPTVNVSVTRNADYPTMPIGPWHTLASGTWNVEFDCEGAAAATTPLVLNVSDGSTANADRIFIGQAIGKSASSTTFTNSVNDGRIDSTQALTFNTVTKAAVSLASASRQIVASGVLGGSSVTGTRPLAVTAVDVGNGTGGAQINGHVRRVRYWPRALSNAELQAATT